MKTRKSVFAFNIKHKNLKNKLFLSCKNKNTLTPLNSSKTKISNDEKDKDNYINNNNIFNENFSFNLNFINESNNKIKTLAMINNGIIYWLRKLYIIIQNKPININTLEKKLLNIYFYFPIKEANTSKYKIHLYNPKRSKISEKFFCNNLDDISKLIRSYLKFNKISDYSKINLYDENFHYIKSCQDLEKKNEKYKVLYAKVIDLSKEQFEQKINKCVLHDKTWKSFDIMDVDKHKNIIR